MLPWHGQHATGAVIAAAAAALAGRSLHGKRTSATTPLRRTPVSGEGLAVVRPCASVNGASCATGGRDTML